MSDLITVRKVKFNPGEYEGVYSEKAIKTNVALTIGNLYLVIDEVYPEYNSFLIFYKIKDDNGNECVINSVLFDSVLFDDEHYIPRQQNHGFNFNFDPHQNQPRYSDEYRQKADEAFIKLYKNLNECLILCGISDETRTWHPVIPKAVPVHIGLWNRMCANIISFIQKLKV